MTLSPSTQRRNNSKTVRMHVLMLKTHKMFSVHREIRKPNNPDRFGLQFDKNPPTGIWLLNLPSVKATEGSYPGTYKEKMNNGTNAMVNQIQIHPRKHILKPSCVPSVVSKYH